MYTRFVILTHLSNMSVILNIKSSRLLKCILLLQSSLFFLLFLRDIQAFTASFSSSGLFGSILDTEGRGQSKCDGTRVETRFCLSAKRTSPFKSAGSSVQSTTDSRRVRISGTNAGYTMFRGSVKGTGYPFHSPVSPSLPLPCVTVCHHISTGVCLVGQAF